MFNIVIDDLTRRYTPGESIIGRLRCFVCETGLVETRVKLIGEEYTNYKQSDNQRAAISSSSSDRGWKTNFLETKKVLIRSAELSVGDHEFPFKLRLPRYIPTSYKGRYGHVRFFIRAFMDTRGKATLEDELEFKVFSPIDLNEMTNLWLSPSTYLDELMLNRWFCVHDIIEMEVKLEKNAFVVGEVVNVDVVVSNNSSHNVSEVRARVILRVQAKVATPMQEFLNEYEILASGRHHGMGPRTSKTRSFHLNIMDNAQIPNFEKCSLFTHKTYLEVIAETEASSKPNLKVEVDLVLGHVRVDGQIPSNNVRDKSRPDPILIFPLEHNQRNGKLFKGSAISVPYIPEAYLNPPPAPNNPINSTSRVPPYPTNANQIPVLPEVPSHPVSSSSAHTRRLAAQESTPRTVSIDTPIRGQNTSEKSKDSVRASKDLRPSKDQSLPYPVTSNSPHSERSSQPPYPIKAAQPPYPTRNNPSIENGNPPYPVGNSCPYPTKSSKVRLPYPSNGNPPYPRVKGYESRTAIPPYPVGNNSPYPTGKMNNVAPYPTVANLPYPKEESEGLGSIGKMPMPSNSRSASFDREDPPYPIEGAVKLSNKISMPSSSFERENLPYPREGSIELSTNMPMPSISRGTSFDRPSNFRGASFERESLPYPTEEADESSTMPLPSRILKEESLENPIESKRFSRSTAPYPLTTSSPYKPKPLYSIGDPNPATCSPTVGNTAPYPPENLSKHSTLGFPKFVPMPMPSKGSPITCDSIGFAVPTTTALEDSRPVPPPIDVSSQPSAPPLSEIQTPSIEGTADIDDVELMAELSGTSSDSSLFASTANADQSRLPELPTPPSEEVDVGATYSATAPPSYEEIMSLMNKKETRPKRERQLAL